jgi:hypothetical protein
VVHELIELGQIPFPSIRPLVIATPVVRIPSSLLHVITVASALVLVADTS